MEKKARAVGINHVALEVGDIDEALSFYGELFDLKLRGREEQMAFIELGDQFIALFEGRTRKEDERRHFGLVVDDRQSVNQAVDRLGAERVEGPGLDFLDPWGNHIQVVEYAGIQFTKAPEVLAGMGLADLEKSAEALAELRDKGMASK